MKFADILKKIFVVLINGWLIAYLIMLWMRWDMIVQAAYADQNVVYFVVLLAIALYAFVNYSIKSFHLSWARTTVSVLWLFMLVVGHYILANNGADGIFVWDIVKVIGVVFIIAWPAKLFMSDAAVEKVKESKMEIIEA